MKQLKFMILINLIISISYQQYLDLTFVPDVGLRLNDVGIQKAHLDSSGTYYLYYTQGPDSGVAISYDGLNFTFVSLQEYPDYRFKNNAKWN